MNRFGNRSAFTLIELLVVILVIGILIAVAAPSFLGQADKAKESAAKQRLSVAYKAAKAAVVDKEGSYSALGVTALAAAIGLSEPQLSAVASASAVEGKIAANLVGTTLELRAVASSGVVCTLTAPMNAQISLSCEAGSSGAAASPVTGGVVTDVGAYRIHTFNSSGTLNVSASIGSNVEVLVVAGGGGGGYSTDRTGGGGGAGGLIYNASLPLAVQSYPVTVGLGGAAASLPDYCTTTINGGGSTFASLSAVGGGCGAPGMVSGGSGGGGHHSSSGSAGTAGQGNAGANGWGSGVVCNGFRGGGGGGAGAAAVQPTSTQPGHGGAGAADSISGSSVFYAGGGGGGTQCAGFAGGTGGVGGGGAGSTNGGASVAGVANTGGGGGGGGKNPDGTILAPGSPGGSGVVIVRYLR